jgi:conjugative relaxase-like TrwC/TraI family protein
LNVGVLAPGSEQYYLGSVAQGVEDYYLGGEVPGRWIGRGAELLGLAGEVAGDDLVAVLADRDPRSGSQLGCAANRTVSGFDLTFSTPKTVSILFGLGEREVALVVSDAHEEAVDAALGYLERNAVWSRRGRNGVDEVVGDGLVGAAFRHRTSRAGDPHLHTHVLVANTVQGPDGKWRTLDFRHVFAHTKTAGYLYEAHLRHLLSERLGVKWGRVCNGTAELPGIDNRVRRMFSTRRIEIEAAMAARGETSARAAQVATLETRRPKDRDVDAIHLRAGWLDKAHAAGFDPASLSGLLDQQHTEPLTDRRRRGVERHLVGPHGLTERASTFDRRAVVQAWCDQLPTGAPVADIEAAADRFLAGDEDIVALPGRATGAIRSVDGRVLSSVATGRRYSTLELVALESRQVAASMNRVHEGCAVVDDADLAASFRAHPTLSDEQARAVATLCGAGHGVDVVTAPAGAGKTFTMDAARHAWEHAGHRVIGAALAARAAAELQASAGIPATTLDALLGALDRRATTLDTRCVMVVDEAGMVGTRRLARLLDHAGSAGAKVVLVGDSRQLPEINAGGLLAGLTDRLPGVALTENRRQRDEWERHALRQLRDGDIDTAIGSYRDHGRITLGDNAEDTRARLVADWWAARLAGQDVIMLAGRRSDVDDLNRRARTRLEPAGSLSGSTLLVDAVPFQAGDEVMTLRNDRRLHVRNGGRGTVAAIDAQACSVTVAFRTGELTVLPADYLAAGRLTHAYAITVHKAQGLTCDQAFTLATETLYREQGYVALSRGRLGNHLYMVGPRPLDPDTTAHAPTTERSPEELLASGLSTSKAQTLAVDHLLDPSLLTWTIADLFAEQRRLRLIVADAPEDRTRGIEALTRTRDALVDDIHGLDQRRAELTEQHRPRRERRRGPDPDLLLVEAKRADLEQRLANVELDLDTALASARARETFLDEHAPVLRRLEQIDDILYDRIDRAVCRAINDQPTYLTRALGALPLNGEPVSAWIDAATVIETYRLERGVTDKHHPLGPEPRDPFDRSAWQEADRQVRAFVREGPAREPDVGELDVGPDVDF